MKTKCQYAVLFHTIRKEAPSISVRILYVKKKIEINITFFLYFTTN